MPPQAPPAPIPATVEPDLDEFESLYRDLTLLNLPLPNSKKLLQKREAETEKANLEKLKKGA